MRYDLEEKLGHKEDDFDAADDRKPREEPHRSSDETHLSFSLDLLVPFDVVKGCCVKIDSDKSKVWFVWNLNSCQDY